MLAFLQLKGQCFLNVTQTLAVGFGNAGLTMTRPRQDKNTAVLPTGPPHPRLVPWEPEGPLDMPLQGDAAEQAHSPVFPRQIQRARLLGPFFPFFRDTQLMFVLLGQLQLLGWKDPIRKRSNRIRIFSL